MALITTNSKYALGALRMPEPQNADVIAVRMEHSLAANPSANDVAWLGDVPAGCKVVDAVLDAPDLDTNGSPTITISLGVLNAGKTDLDVTYIAASTIGQTSGMARPTTNVLFRTAPNAAKQSIGLKFPAVSATFAAGVIGATIFYRSQQGGL